MTAPAAKILAEADAWTLGQPNKVYPDGYTLAHLGPAPVAPVPPGELSR